MATQFGSFKRGKKQYNCAYDPKEKTRKGFKVRYYRNNPLATNFYRTDSECYAKVIYPLVYDLPPSSTMKG